MRATKHHTETNVAGLHADHPLIRWMVSHCCLPHCRFHVRLDGRTLVGLACFAASRLGTGSRSGFKCIGWIWLGKTENSDEHLCGDGERRKRGRRQARWRPFQSQAKENGGNDVEPPLDLQMAHATTIDQHVNLVEAFEEKTQETACQRRWYVTEMGCPRYGERTRRTERPVPATNRRKIV